MKPVVSILALAVALASNVAFASPEADGAKDTVKVAAPHEHAAKKDHSRKDEARKEESKKEDSRKDDAKKKPSKQHARTIAKGHAHGHDKAPAVVQATMRMPATTKEREAKPSKTKKTNKKADAKHPAPAGVAGDPGARDHESHAVGMDVGNQASSDVGHAEPQSAPPSSALAQVVAKPSHANLPVLPSPSSALKNASAHEPVAKEPKVKEPEMHVAQKDAKKHGAKATHSAAKTEPRNDAKAIVAPKAPCLHASVEFLRGAEIESFPLTQCDGTVASHAQEKLSVVLRPFSVSRPQADSAKVMHKTTEISSGIMKVDPGLALRLDKVLEHFTTEGHAPKVAIVSGSRPTSTGSLHSLGRAMDFRLEGVDNLKLAEFCKTIADTGCGYYPNSSFVHMDVREAGSGHTAWIDASGPGEAPRYVSQWPLPATDTSENKAVAAPDKVAGDSTEAAETPAETPAH